MAVTFDASAQRAINATGSDTFSQTCTGSDRALLVGIAGTLGGGAAVSAVTYNAVAMTKVGGVTLGSSFAEIWRLIAPATGANNVVITSSVTTYGRAFSASFAGVHQTTPIANTASYSGQYPGYPQNTAISTPTGGIAVDIAAYMDSGTGPHINPDVQNSATILITNTNDWWGCVGGAYKAGATQLGWSANGNGSSGVNFLDYLVSLNQASTATVPGAPTIGAAVAASTALTVSFTPPASDGGSAITGYTATASSGPSQSGASSPITITGLTNGVAVTAHVHATNAIGNSANSAESNSVTPSATPVGMRYRANMMGNL